MEFPPDPTLQATVEALSQGFAPIFGAWRASQLAAPATAEECLHQDLIALAGALAVRDPHGRRLEFKLLSEMLALLQNDNKMPYSYRVETVDKEIGSAIAAGSGTVSVDGVPELIIFQAVNAWGAASPERAVEARAVVTLLMELVNDFVMRDGTVSDAEIEFINAVESRFRF